ncbi:protoporphyrinogen oxidase isoform X2 [Hemibagrus wyckioides]|uniref:protoporphyrinogen oxidase isoform X2 n=1 Tax=Hemibagrus wyckioides TaxID=337641 RepID=UPI00266CE014|nr:protoporphyrinogen oxidase isoform X2 [Hemibagrus wyckioides]
MQKCVAVLGGGIGGLSACYYLSKSTHVSKVVLLEATGRFGGWINTTRREDGAVFEHGPRGVRPAGAVGRNTLNMLSDLGLECEILPVPHDHVASKNRFLYMNGEIHKLPSSLSGVVKTVPPFSSPIILSVMKEILVRKGKEEDESVHSFMSRRFGSELADIAMDCLCRGVFAGDSRKLSVRSCFLPLHRAEQDWGSVLLGLLLSGGGGGEKAGAGSMSALARRARAESWSQWSLTDGMQTLPDALQEALRGRERVELHHSTPVRTLTHTAGGWEIKLENGATLNADHVISALPASVLASLLPPAAAPLSHLLCEINTVSVGLVNLEYEGSVLPVTGFGHLIPSSVDKSVLGVVYDSVPFPQHNRRGEPTTRMTVMMGGAWFEETLGPPDEVKDQVLLDGALQAVRSHLNITSSPVWSRAAVLKSHLNMFMHGELHSTVSPGTLETTRGNEAVYQRSCSSSHADRSLVQRRLC